MANAAAQASSAVALEPRDEEVLRQVWSGAKIGSDDANSYAVEKASHLTSAAVFADSWAKFNNLLIDVDQDIQEGAARVIMFALTRAYDKTPQTS